MHYAGEPMRHRLRAAVLVGLAATSTVEARAQAACPTEARAGKSLELSSASGRRNVQTLLDGGRVRIAEQNPASPTSFPRTTVALRGLLGLQIETGGSKASIDYGAPAEALFPLAVGRQHVIEYASQIGGGTPLKARMAMAIIEPVRHEIGGCAYDALLVVRFSEFEDGRRTPMRYDVYVPRLQAVLKSTLLDEEKRAIIEGETFEFETIVEK